MTTGELSGIFKMNAFRNIGLCIFHFSVIKQKNSKWFKVLKKFQTIKKWKFQR